MKKLLLVSLVLLLCVLGVTACGQNPSSNSTTDQTGQSNTSEQKNATIPTQKPAITVALDATYAPMESESNGEIVGFDADIIKAIAKQMGREVVLKNVGWNSIFDDLQANKFDLIISSVTINEERKKTMLFSDPYYTSTALILTRTSSNIASAADLKNKKIAVQTGTTTHELFKTKVPGATIKNFESATDALNCFASKQADAVSVDAPVLLDFAKQKNDPEYKLVIDNNFFPQESFGIVASKFNSELIAEVNKALKEIKSNGEYDKIYDKYFPAY